MARDTRNIGASVRARLLARSRSANTDFQILLTRYVLERLLYRLSVSEYRDQFILKGALLFVTWVADPFRPTRDLDLLGYGTNSPETLVETFKAICATDVPDDGVVFDIDALNAAPIREELEYGGVRVLTVAVVDGARIPIQIDIGFGDIITPEPIEIDYPILLDFPPPHIRTYPVETVVAEKFNAMVTLGIANSRLKDFYDLWIISRTFEFNRIQLAAALGRTFERRQTLIPRDVPTGLTETYAEQWQGRWNAYLRREHMHAAPGDLRVLLRDLREFLIPVLFSANEPSRWAPGGPWTTAA